MASKTGIINGALRRIGGSRITSIDDGSTNANYVMDIYDDLLDDLLRSGEWKFATTRASLSRLVATPTFGFDYAYALPSNWLRTVRISDNDAGVSTFDYQEETLSSQKVILASRENVYLQYVYRETDPNQWSADFRMAMIFALARDLAVPVASSGNLQARMAVMADRWLAKAKSSDSMASFPTRRPLGSWATSRGGRHPRIFPTGSV